MSSRNPFGLLGEFDHDDPELAVATSVQKTPPRAAPVAKFPSKPVPPAQAVRDARGGAQGGIRGRAPRGRGAPTFANKNAGGYAGDQGWEDGDGGRPTERARGAYSGPRPYRGGGRRGAHANNDAGGERRVFERRSGTGRGMEMKRDGSGRGNWGTTADDIVAQGAMEVPVGDIVGFEKESELVIKTVAEGNKEDIADEMKETAEKEEDKEMTLEEYQKVMEEKRKALIAMKAAERKVEVDKEFESMTLLSIKKGSDDIFIKLGSEKDSRKSRDDTDRDERTKKPVSINEFLKPTDGERHYRTGGRGRGRGRGDRGNGPFGYETSAIPEATIKIEDTKQFPLLGGK